MMVGSIAVQTEPLSGLTAKLWPCLCGLIWFADLAGNRFHWVYLRVGGDPDWAGSYTQFAKRVGDKQYCKCGKEIDDLD